MTFAVPEWFNTGLHETGNAFYCPSGHPLVFKVPETPPPQEKPKPTFKLLQGLFGKPPPDDQVNDSDNAAS